MFVCITIVSDWPLTTTLLDPDSITKLKFKMNDYVYTLSHTHTHAGTRTHARTHSILSIRAETRKNTGTRTYEIFRLERRGCCDVVAMMLMRACCLYDAVLCLATYAPLCPSSNRILMFVPTSSSPSSSSHAKHFLRTASAAAAASRSHSSLANHSCDLNSARNGRARCSD